MLAESIACQAKWLVAHYPAEINVMRDQSRPAVNDFNAYNKFVAVCQGEKSLIYS